MWQAAQENWRRRARQRGRKRRKERETPSGDPNSWVKVARGAVMCRSLLYYIGKRVCVGPECAMTGGKSMWFCALALLLVVFFYTSRGASGEEHKTSESAAPHRSQDHTGPARKGQLISLIHFRCVRARKGESGVSSPLSSVNSQS